MNASTELINLHAKKLREAHFGLMFVKCWQNYIKSRLKNSFQKEPSLETWPFLTYMGILNFWNISLLLFFHLFLFFGYVWCLIQDSICDFTAYAHTTVSMLSAKYNHSERWYNYTTPKSFLEQIILYKILLKRKSSISGHVEHLVNGMEKLKAAAFQVNCESHNPFFSFFYM